MKRYYSRFLLFVVGLLLTTTLSAQFDGFNYKSVIYNNGTVVANQAVTLQFSYYDGATLVYQETFTPTTSNAGIVVVNMGQGSVVSGTFSGINFSNPISYKIEVNLGSGYTNMGTYDFKSVPYAINAQNAQSANALNSALSVNDLSDGKTDNYSLFIGTNTGSNDDGSNYNVGIGQSCLTSNTGGYNNVALGTGSMSSNTTGSQNTAIGSNTLFTNQTSSGNTAVGYAAMNSSNGAAYNTAMGYSSLMLNTTGDYNVAMGYDAIRSLSSGNNNTAIGTGAGYNNSTGNYNVFIGNNAGYNETGSNKLYITNSNTAYPLIYGDFNTGLLTINGDLTIKDGTQGAGKVFTSDANGLGSWQSTAKSHTLYYGAPNVSPWESADGFYRNSTQFYINASGSSSDAALIPINLPVGATVTAITYYYTDTNSTVNLEMKVYRSDTAINTVYALSPFTSSGNIAGEQAQTISTGFTILDGYTYSVMIMPEGNVNWPGSSISIRKVKLVYTY